jgi:hypothetical protein
VFTTPDSGFNLSGKTSDPKKEHTIDVVCQSLFTDWTNAAELIENRN